MDEGQKTRNELKTSELEEACTTKEKLKSNEKNEKTSNKQVNKCKLSLFRNSLKSVKTLGADVDLNETDEFQDKQVPFKLQERLSRKKPERTSDNVEHHSPIKKKSVSEEEKTSSESTKQTCPTCQKQIAPWQIQAHILSCLKQFALVKNTADDEKRSDTTSFHLCQICQKDISHMNTTRRAQHVNRCIDEKEKVDQEKKEKKRLLETAKTAVLDCPICGKPLKTAQSRQTHIKKCALTYGVATERLLKLIKDQEGERTLQVTAGILPNTVSLPTKATKDGEKISKKQRLPKSKSDEDLQLAMALSTSLAEQERLQEEVITGGKGKKSRIKKKASETIPLLLQLTKQQAVDRISSKVTELLLPPPSVSQEQEQSAPCSMSRIDTLSVPCEVYTTSRNRQTTRLWNESKLTEQGGSTEDFYVEALMHSVTVSTVKAGTKLKRMSEIPGRRSSVELERERDLKEKSDSNILQQTESRTQTTSSPPATQTAAILAELAAEADINSSLPDKCVNSNQSQEELHFSGFCPENPIEIPEDLLRSIKLGFSSSIHSMVGNEMYSDVAIETRERKIPAHKIFLHTRCPKILESLCVDGLTIDMSLYSEDVVLTILNFVYAGEVKVYPASLQEVLQLSSCIELTELKEICESIRNRIPEDGDKESKQGGEQNLLENTLWSSSDSEGDIAVGHAEGEEVQGHEEDEEDEWREMFHTQRKNLHKMPIEESLENNDKGCDSEEVEDDGDDNRENDSEEDLMEFLLEEHGKIKNENINEYKIMTTLSVDCPSGNQNVEIPVPSVSKVNFSGFPLENLPDATNELYCKDAGSENLHLMKTLPATKSSQKPNDDCSVEKRSVSFYASSVIEETDSKHMKIHSSPDRPNKELVQSAPSTEDYDDVQYGLSDQELFSDDDGVLADTTVAQCVSLESSDKNPSESPVSKLDKRNNISKQGDIAGSSSEINQKDYQENSIAHPILLSDSDSNEEEVKLDTRIVKDKHIEPKVKPVSEELDEFSHGDSKLSSNSVTYVNAKSENKRNPKYRFVSIEKRSYTQKDTRLVGSYVSANIAGGDMESSCDSESLTNSPTKSKTSNIQLPRTAEESQLINHRSSLNADDSLYVMSIPSNRARSTFMLTTPNPGRADVTDGETAKVPRDRKDKTPSVSYETKSLDQLSGSSFGHGDDTNNPDSTTSQKGTKTTGSNNTDEDNDDNDHDDDDDDEVIVYSANSDDGELSSSSKVSLKFKKTSDVQSDNVNEEEDPWEGFNDVGYTEDLLQFEDDPVLTVPEEISDRKSKEFLSHEQEKPLTSFKTPTISDKEKKKRKKKNWVPPSPFTPIPDYNAMNTPQLKKNIDKYGLRPACKKRMISVLTQIYAETHQYETDSDCELDMERLEKANRAKLPTVPSKNDDKKGKKKSRSSQPTMKRKKPAAQTSLPPVCSLKDVVSDDPLSSSQSSDISDLPEESFMALAEEESSSYTSQCTKEDLFKKLAAFIQYDTDLYSQVLMYQPVVLDVLKKRIGEAGMKCSMEKLLEFLDEKCINFTMKNTNKRKPRNQRRRPKMKKTKSTVNT